MSRSSEVSCRALLGWESNELFGRLSCKRILSFFVSLCAFVVCAFVVCAFVVCAFVVCA